MEEHSSRDGDIPSSGRSSLPLRPSEISLATVSQGDLPGSARQAEASDKLRDSPLIVAAPTHGTTTQTGQNETGFKQAGGAPAYEMVPDGPGGEPQDEIGFRQAAATQNMLRGDKCFDHVSQNPP